MRASKLPRETHAGPLKAQATTFQYVINVSRSNVTVCTRRYRAAQGIVWINCQLRNGRNGPDLQQLSEERIGCQSSGPPGLAHSTRF